MSLQVQWRPAEFNMRWVPQQDPDQLAMPMVRLSSGFDFPRSSYLDLFTRRVVACVAPTINSNSVDKGALGGEQHS